MNQQHDVNEFFLALSDTMERQMRNTPVSGTYNKLFEGELENVIECININYESTRKETFNCLTLTLGGNDQQKITIEDSLA